MDIDRILFLSLGVVDAVPLERRRSIAVALLAGGDRLDADPEDAAQAERVIDAIIAAYGEGQLDHVMCPDVSESEFARARKDLIGHLPDGQTSFKTDRKLKTALDALTAWTHRHPILES